MGLIMAKTRSLFNFNFTFITLDYIRYAPVLEYLYNLLYSEISMSKAVKKRKKFSYESSRIGKLKIGDNWSAISIIALSQNNPLKAIAEFVENSIDARARHITIIRGKEQGEYYLKIIDDGQGIHLDENGMPDFKYVATHICDSIKKQLKKQGEKNIQGEFGIGLLSFWTVGEKLTLTSAGSDGKLYQMVMKKDEPGYTINTKRALLAHQGTELVIHPLLSGIRQLHGEKMQNYLASELRDRIRSTGVKIKIKDRFSRREYNVEPRQFAGALVHELPPLNINNEEIYYELYLNPHNAENTVSLYRRGTRVIPNLASLDLLNRGPWNQGYLQGMIDVPFLNLTPGTRDGIIRDEQFNVLCQGLNALEEKLKVAIEEEKRASEEKASREILRSVQKALKEALLALPREEYNWFDIYSQGIGSQKRASLNGTTLMDNEATGAEKIKEQQKELDLNLTSEKKFFEYAGPLFQIMISPSSSIIKVGESKNLRLIARDRNKRQVENVDEILWQIKEGEGTLSNTANEVATFQAPQEPGITTIQVTVKQQNIVCQAESIITITDSLIKREDKDESCLNKGLPGYTFKRAPGELWRSRYDQGRNLITINNGHADYLYASKINARKLKYICKLFSKELILHNFLGFNKDELLERMVELSLYTEENLK
jgi:hypothetical protein